MDEPPRNKPSSDQLRTAQVSEYLAAHAKPNGNGHLWKGFLRSNLFTALIIWLLSQVVIAVGTFVAINYRLTSIAEWKGGIDSTIKRMDEQGTVRSHYTLEQQSKDISRIDGRLTKAEEDTSRFRVLESEHRRLTTDVEQIKNASKK